MKKLFRFLRNTIIGLSLILFSLGIILGTAWLVDNHPLEGIITLAALILLPLGALLGFIIDELWIKR